MNLVTDKIFVFASVAILLLTACSKKDEDNVVAQDQIVSGITLRAKTFVELEAEVKSIINVNFKCDRQLTFTECYNFAKSIVTIFKKPNFKNDVVQTIRSDFFNDISNRNRVFLKYDNSTAVNENLLVQHYNDFRTIVVPPTTPPTWPAPTFTQTLAKLRSHTGVYNLTCVVTPYECARAVDNFIQATRGYPINTYVSGLLVNYMTQPTLISRVLTINSNMSSTYIRNYLNIQATPAPTPSEPTLGEITVELRDLTGKLLICDSQVTNRECANIGKKLLRLYRNDRLPRTTIRKFVVTAKRRLISNRRLQELRFDNTRQEIRQIVREHSRNFY